MQDRGWVVSVDAAIRGEVDVNLMRTRWSLLSMRLFGTEKAGSRDRNKCKSQHAGQCRRVKILICEA